MSEGQIRCVGPTADLKTRFGEGFKLTIQVLKHQEQGLAHKLVIELDPAASLLSKMSGTRCYHLNKKNVTLNQIFSKMEKAKKSFHIGDWAVTNTTLEEIFLQISKHRDKNNLFFPKI